MKRERTLVVIKPDGVQRTLIGEVIKRIERIGLKLVGLKMVIPNEEFIEKHYTLHPEWIENVGKKSIESYKKKGVTPPTEDAIEQGQKVLKVLVNYMTSGPVVAMVWQGAHSAEIVRKIVGGTEPLTSNLGTIRGDFVLDSYQMADTDERAVRNLIHASGCPKEADMEIRHWFNPEELLEYRLIQEQILYDVNLDGLIE